MKGKGHSEGLESQRSSMTKFMDTANSSQTSKVIAAPPTPHSKKKKKGYTTFLSENMVEITVI